MQRKILALLGCAILAGTLASCGGGGSSSGGGTSNTGTIGTDTATPSPIPTPEPSSFLISSIAGPGTAILVRQPNLTKGESSLVSFHLTPGFTRLKISGDCLDPVLHRTVENVQVWLRTKPVTDDCTVAAHAEIDESEESYWTSLQVWPSVVYAHEITEGTEIEISVRLKGTMGLLNNQPARIAKITATASIDENSNVLIGNHHNGWATILERTSPVDNAGGIDLYKGAMRPKSLFRNGLPTGNFHAGNGRPIIYSDDSGYDGVQVIYIAVQLWDAFGNRLQTYNSRFPNGEPRRDFHSQPLIVLDNHIPQTNIMARIDGFDVYDHFIHIRADDIHLVDSEVYVSERIMQLYNSSSDKSNSAFGQPTFLELALEIPCVGDCWTGFSTVKNAASNIGRSPFDNSSVYGNNPSLTGIIFSQPHTRSGNVVVHEIGHTFSAYLNDQDLSLASGSHWRSWADIPMGVMDGTRGLGSALMDKTPEGTWFPTSHKPPLIEKRAYSMLDLYLAGMAYPHEVPGFHTLLSTPDSPQMLQNLEYVDIKRIISVYGERSPPYDGKRVDWTMLTIVVTEGELLPAVAAFYNHRNRYLMRNHTYESAGYTTVVSVPDACRGRCTFDTKVPRL